MAVEMEKRIVFELGDILKVSVQCNQCQKEVSYPMGSTLPSMDNCPLCGKPWAEAPESVYQEDKLRTIDLMNALERFRSREYQTRATENRTRWRIKLELPAAPD